MKNEQLMTWGTRVVVIAALAAIASAFAPGARAQSGTADMAALRDEMVATHKSIDQLVTLFKTFSDSVTKNNQAGTYLRRIEIAERRVASIETDLRAARADLKTQTDGVARSAGQLESLRMMQAQDKTGNAAAAFEADRKVTTKAGQDAKIAAQAAQARVTALEQDLAQQRGLIAQMEATVDRIGG